MTTLPDALGSERWERALASIASRGPDATGEWASDGISFGHQRLSIIGLGSEGAQPRVTDPEHVLVFNGEIYNFRELAEELGIAARSDTQVLYEIGRRGEWSRWIRRLRGMFAFVHYHQTAKALTVARDPFGIKPLFYRHHSDGSLSFASTVAALAELSPMTLAPSPVALTGFLANGVFSHGTTAFSEISKIEPGVLKKWQRTERGWVVKRQQIELSGWPSETTSGALRDSVAAHLVADVEVGVLLSGGVDSTLIAALAAEMSPGVRTFCLTNPQSPAIDEAALARHNASLLGTTHVEVPVTPATLADRADALIRSTGEPFSDAAYLPLSALSEVVAEHVKVALAGEGADELFGGYRRYDVERLIDSPGFGSSVRMAGRLAAFDRRWPHPVS
ncbi:MAG: asparagine synthase (glutamine-hydrolyzing), partial [Planctomycetales bacterium]|nr:asparagine synthase (glutamine-hydrolyzing) [Planctomycetales bacterium]